MKKFLLPIAVGAVVFGAVTAFAATLDVSGTSLGAGNATVASCNAKAKVTYNTAIATAGPVGSYVVTTAPIITTDAANVANTDCAGKSYKVTLLDGSSGSLAEKTGTLDANGAAVSTSAPNFSTNNIDASLVAGISVVITG